MKPGRLLKSTAMALLLAAPLQAEPAHPSLSAFEGVVSEWVAVRGQAARETADWRDRQAAWVEQIRLLEEEKRKLEGELAAYRRDEAALLEKRQDLLRQQSDREALLKAIHSELTRAEADVRAWERLIPEPLADPLRKTFRECPRADAPSSDAGVSRRLQVVMALYTQIETLQHMAHVTKQLLSVDEGIRREVDVLYLGLAVGFAVSPDGTWAAVGVPGSGGWEWRPQPELASSVRRAVAVCRREQPAALVSLPLRMDEEGKP